MASTSTSAPDFEFYPCNRGGGQPIGYHRFEMNQYGVCCIYCGKRGPQEPLEWTVTYRS